MVIGPQSNPVIDTQLIPLARQDSQGTSSHNNHDTPSKCTMSTLNNNSESNTTKYDDNNNSVRNTTYKSSIIPEHSSLPSPLSPPLSVSPPSFGPSMADYIASRPPIGSSTASLPPLHPSASPSLDNNNNSSNNNSNNNNNSLAQTTLSTPTVPFIQTSPEAWLAHAAQQRRHLSTGSFSSIASSTSILLSPDVNTPQSPTALEFGESERIKDEAGQDNDDQEPELVLNVRPSELRASLMARAKRSSARMQQKRSESVSLDQSLRLSGLSNQSYNSLSSAYDSRPSARSSISSSISGWTPRARSISVSSQGSNDSVNLDALIAEGSDINEERPLELEDGDDVEWSKDQQRQLQQQQQQQQLQEQQQQDTLANVNRGGLRSRSTTGGSQADMHQYEDQDVGDYNSGSERNSEVNSEAPTMEEDEEFDETLRGFSHISIHSMDIPEVRGLTMAGGRRSTVTSPRFPDGRNPFDLEADYADTPAGLRSGDRMSNISNYSSAGSDRSSISRLPAAGNSRLPASGIKAPSTRLAQPGTRSMLAQPKAARSSGLQAPKAGSQVPRSGLQAPKAGSSSALMARGSSIAVPGRTTANTKIPPADQRKGATSSRLPSNTANSTVRTGTKSQIAPPNSSRKPSVTSANRQSLLQAPSASRIASTTTGRPPSRTTTNPTSPKRSLTTPNLLTSPTRSASDRHLNSAYMVSPTSSQGSSSSLTARDTVTSVSRRLSSATGTSQLTQPKTAVRGRSISMYGSGGLYTNRDIAHQQQQDYEEADYAVLTPPQSPSSKAGSRAATGIPRSGMATPSRLVAPTVSTGTGRAVSPPQLSAGSNSSNQGSMLPRSHTPTSSLPVSRMTSGLVSPRAGRH